MWSYILPINLDSNYNEMSSNIFVIKKNIFLYLGKDSIIDIAFINNDKIFIEYIIRNQYSNNCIMWQPSEDILKLKVLHDNDTKMLVLINYLYQLYSENYHTYLHIRNFNSNITKFAKKYNKFNYIIFGEEYLI
jgi:hypothetical protein